VRRFTTKGRNDPWRTHRPYRATAHVLPMEQPRKDGWVRRMWRAWRRTNGKS
jgi:hypothetical protein